MLTTKEIGKRLGVMLSEAMEQGKPPELLIEQRRYGRQVVEAVRSSDKPEGMPEKYKEQLAKKSFELEHLGDEFERRFAVVAMKLRNDLAADLLGPHSDDLPFSFFRKERIVLTGVLKSIEGEMYRSVQKLRKDLKSISSRVDSVIL